MFVAPRSFKLVLMDFRLGSVDEEHGECVSGNARQFKYIEEYA